MYDRSVLGTRLMPGMRKRQDYALWLSIMRDGADACGLAEPLAVYRVHQAGPVSSNKLSLVQHNRALFREHEHLWVPRATWWTNFVADWAAAEGVDALRELAVPLRRMRGGYAGYAGRDRVPARTGMGNGEILVAEGTAPGVLDDGVSGCCTEPVQSALLWDTEGSFSLAAHRVGHGAEFRNIHRVRSGDAIVFETAACGACTGCVR